MKSHHVIGTVSRFKAPCRGTAHVSPHMRPTVENKTGKAYVMSYTSYTVYTCAFKTWMRMLNDRSKKCVR